MPSVQRCFQVLICALVSLQAFADEPSLEEQVDELYALRATGDNDQFLEKARTTFALLVDNYNADPKNGNTRFLMARVHLIVEDPEEARVAIEGAIAVAPNVANYHSFRGLILSNYLNEYDEAIKSCRQAVELEPDQPTHLVRLGLVQGNANRLDDAAATFKAAREKFPNEMKVWENSAVLEYQQKNFAVAVEYFTRAIELDPKNIELLLSRATVFHSNNKLDAALNDLKEFLALNPAELRALSLCSIIYSAQGNDEEREKCRQSWLTAYRRGRAGNVMTREIYTLDEYLVEVGEYAELTGEHGLVYTFKVMNPESRKMQFVISLGSYEFTTAASRELGNIKNDERVYHLDYYQGDFHATYGVFNVTPPTYAKTKEFVQKILRKEIAPQSSSSGPTE